MAKRKRDLDEPSELMRRPKAGDGTQDVPGKESANWYGKSTKPQEEYINDREPPNSFERSGTPPKKD